MTAQYPRNDHICLRMADNAQEMTTMTAQARPRQIMAAARQVMAVVSQVMNHTADNAVQHGARQIMTCTGLCNDRTMT